MQIPKLVVFDVDGTLLDWHGNMTDATKRTLTRLRAAGIPLALATGRPMAIADHTLHTVGGADWMACGNGSTLFEVATGQLLRDRCLPEGVAAPIVTGMRVRLPGVGFALEVGNTVIEEHGFNRRVPEDPIGAPVGDVLVALRSNPGPVRRLISFHDDYDHRLDELAAVLDGFLPADCQIQFAGLPIVDVSPLGDHKAAALEVLVQHLGIEPADVIAFGDGRNDVEMLEWAGVGVAMGNARADVQVVADHVTAHIDDGGIAAFLDPLLDG